jgi:ATP-dependent Clp endopeptidase proteolytic subunit ClpP
MEQLPARRLVRMDVVDEKIGFLADRGIFLMGGCIDTDVFYGFFMGMLPKLFSENKKKLWVILNSPGGDIFQGLAIHDLFIAIAKQGVEVNIVGIGMVASMAVCIMQSATRRYAFPNTQFTVHQASLRGDSERQEVNEMIETAKEVERINGIVLNIISERSGMGMEELMRISKKTDYSVSANKATAKEFGPHGLIDEVVVTFPFSFQS